MFSNPEVMYVCVAAKNIVDRTFATDMRNTSKGIRSGLRSLRRKLGKRPAAAEVEALLKTMALDYERHSPANPFGDGNPVHSFGVRLKGGRLYVCESMGGGDWAVL